MPAKPKDPLPAEDRRKRRHAQSREEILEAARRVLMRDGIAGTTLTAVAKEAGLTKAALYYYFESKDAMLFELMLRVLEREVTALETAVSATDNGAEALRAIIETTVARFARQPDDFRLLYFQPQVEHSSYRAPPEAMARLRPLNDRAYGGATKKVEVQRRGRGGVDPRRLTFLAHISALGLATYKGLVDSTGGSLAYSDEVLLDDFAKIFGAAVKGT
jgi:AcrR family transcriptional regulator